MTKPLSIIKAEGPEEYLLEKVKFTQQSLEEKLANAASDIEALYYLSANYLLTVFAQILSSKETINQKKDTLKLLLAERWEHIKGTSYGYCERPRDPLNQLCVDIAFYISPLPEDLAECDDWQPGQGPYFLLMPSLKACQDIVVGTNIHRYQPQEFILSEDNTRYIPLFEAIHLYFHGSASKPLHTVFSKEQLADKTLNKKNDPLRESEFHQLNHHSALATKIMINVATINAPYGPFFVHLNELLSGLFAARVEATVSAWDSTRANKTVVEFFDYWDTLVDEMKNHYFEIFPTLNPIFQKLKKPVIISEQDDNVNEIAGELRSVLALDRSHFKSIPVAKLQARMQELLNQLGREIKQSNYVFNPVQKKIKPIVQNVLHLKAEEQSRLIKKHLNLDYPNFLIYVLDQQPDMIPLFFSAFQNSKQKQPLLQQRTLHGTSLLMLTALNYPLALKGLLESLLELNNNQIKEELRVKSATGEALPFIIMQQYPEALPALLAAIERLDIEDQIHLLLGEDGTNTHIIAKAMESNSAALRQLCEQIKQFPTNEIETILGQVDSKGNTLLTTACLNYPDAVAPLMILFKQCNNHSQRRLIAHVNQAGLNLPLLALQSDPISLQAILEVAASLPKTALNTVFTSSEESFFLRACSSESLNFNQAILLLDSFLPDKQDTFLLERDKENNNLLLLTILQQKIPPTLLFNKLSVLSPTVLYSLLNTRNNQGLSPLALALLHEPDYFPHIVALLTKLNEEQQDLLWQQVDANGNYLPTIAALYAPEHLSYVLNHVSEGTLFRAITPDSNGNGVLAITASFQPEHLPLLLNRIKNMTVQQRFACLSYCNPQGDNLVAWILQQDTSFLNSVFELMHGFTLAEQLSLITHRNNQGQHILTIAYAQNSSLLDEILQIADKSNHSNSVILKALPLAHWFDLLSATCADSSVFENFYSRFKEYHAQDTTQIAKLLQYYDVHNNNLMMLILKINPSKVNFIIGDIKTLEDERTQRQIMLQTNDQGENVLSLAEKYTPDATLANLQSFTKRLDKQRFHQKMMTSMMKMQSGESLLSSDMLENCNNDVFFHRLQEKDAQGNNLVGQIIVQAPYRLPMIIQRIKNLLSPTQIIQLFTHINHRGLNCYWLALEQIQAAYLCSQIQSVANDFNTETQMRIFAAPLGHSLIESALKNGMATFIKIMHQLSRLDETKRREIIDHFWREPSQQFNKMVAEGNVDVCHRLISTTRHMSEYGILTLMQRNKNTLEAALIIKHPLIKELFNRWLFSLSQDNRFTLLASFSPDIILSLFNDQQISLINTLTLNQQAKLLGNQDWYGGSVLAKAIIDNHPCQEKLLAHLKLFTPSQQDTLFQGSVGKKSFLHALAIKNPILFKKYVKQLSTLPSDSLFTLFSHIDDHGFIVLDHLEDKPDLYQLVLDIYDQLSLKNQIQLFLQFTGPKRSCLLITSPLRLKIRIVERFMTFPQAAKIEILLAIHRRDPNSLKTLLQTSTPVQFPLLDVIQSLPKPVQAELLSPEQGADHSLITWLLNSNNTQLRQRAVTLLGELDKTNLIVLLTHKNLQGDNLLQHIAKNLPSLFAEVFSFFIRLPTESKTGLLLQQNSNRNLLSDLIDYKFYDHFESLCMSMAEVPMDKKINILSASGMVPITTTRHFVSKEQAALQRQSFVNLLNDKAFFSTTFHLLQTLSPDIQLAILTSGTSQKKAVIDEVKEPEQRKLRVVLQQAIALIKIKKGLKKIAINADPLSREYLLQHQLLKRLESYQNTYYKSVQHIHDLTNGLISDIEEALPYIKTTFTSKNVLTACMKIAGSIIIAPYGAYNLYKSANTHQHVFFQSRQEKILYALENLSDEFKQISSACSGNFFA